MDLTLGDLATVSLLAYALAFVVIGVITVLPMAIVRGERKIPSQTIPKPEIQQEVKKEEIPAELIAIAAAVAVHNIKSRRSSLFKAAEVPERMRWLIRARIDTLSLRTLDLSYTKRAGRR